MYISLNIFFKLVNVKINSISMINHITKFYKWKYIDKIQNLIVFKNQKLIDYDDDGT